MKNVGRYGLLLCLVFLVSVFLAPSLVIGDGEPPPYIPPPGEPCPPPPEPQPEPCPPPPEPQPEPCPPPPEPQPPELGLECWSEAQALYNFSWEELETLKREGFNCFLINCAIRIAGRNKERFLEILYYGHSVIIDIPAVIRVGEKIILQFQIVSNHTGEVISPEVAARIVPNFTAAHISEDGRRMIIILDQERRDICLLFTFNQETRQFSTVWNTAGLKPGEYELYLGLTGLCQFSLTFYVTLVQQEL